MSHVGAVGVSVLVDQPFPFAGVSVSSADVLGLKMLELTVDVVSVCHRCWVMRKIPSKSEKERKNEKPNMTRMYWLLLTISYS